MAGNILKKNFKKISKKNFKTKCIFFSEISKTKIWKKDFQKMFQMSEICNDLYLLVCNFIVNDALETTFGRKHLHVYESCHEKRFWEKKTFVCEKFVFQKIQKKNPKILWIIFKKFPKISIKSQKISKNNFPIIFKKIFFRQGKTFFSNFFLENIFLVQADATYQI